MEPLGGFAEYGIAGMALVALIFGIDVLRRKYRESQNGDRRKSQRVVIAECPHKVEGLAVALEEMAKQARTQTELNTAQIRLMEHNKNGIDRLVDQHRAVDGIETWKVSPRILEEIRDGIRELVAVAKSSGRG